MRIPGPTTRDPFLPLERLVRGLLTVIVAMVVVFLPVAALGIGGWSFGSIGDSEACVTTDAGTFPTIGTSRREEREANREMGLRPGGALRPDTYTVCNEHPTTRDRLTATAAVTLPTIFLFGVLLLIYLVIRAAASHGLFSRATSGRVWVLGWFLIVGSLASEVLRQIMIGITLSGVSKDERWYSTIGNPDISLTAVIAGVGMISVSRVLARAVVLQAEQDATI